MYDYWEGGDGREEIGMAATSEWVGTRNDATSFRVRYLTNHPEPVEG